MVQSLRYFQNNYSAIRIITNNTDMIPFSVNKLSNSLLAIIILITTDLINYSNNVTCDAHGLSNSYHTKVLIQNSSARYLKFCFIREWFPKLIFQHHPKYIIWTNWSCIFFSYILLLSLSNLTDSLNWGDIFVWLFGNNCFELYFSPLFSFIEAQSLQMASWVY